MAVADPFFTEYTMEEEKEFDNALVSRIILSRDLQMETRGLVVIT